MIARLVILRMRSPQCWRSAGVLLAGLFSLWAFAPFGTHAQQLPSVSVLVLRHSNEGLARHDGRLAIQAAQRAQGNLPLTVLGGSDGTSIVGWTPQRIQQYVSGQMQANPADTFIVHTIGHGSPGIPGNLLGIRGGDRTSVTNALANAAFENKQETIWWALNCHSGACRPSYDALPPTLKEYFNTLASSPAALESGPDIQARMMDRLFQAIARRDPGLDRDGNGEVSLRELQDFFNRFDRMRRGDLIFGPNPNDALFGRPSTDQCVAVTPGQSDGRGGLPDYGKMFPDPAESKTNQDLRLSNRGTLEQNKTLATQNLGGTLKKLILPSLAQADEYIRSGFKTYTVDGVQISPGTYRARHNQRVPVTNEWVQATQDCEFKKAPAHPPSPSPPPPPGPGVDGGQGPGGGGSFDQFLSSVLGPLLNQALQQRGGQQAGPPSGSSTPPQTSPSQAAPPVPASEQRTSPPTTGLETLLQPLFHTGIPSTFLEQIIRVVVSLVVNFFQGMPSVATPLGERAGFER